MLLVSVSELVEGDTLSKGLYAPDGRLLLKQGMRLNERLIEGIKRLGQHYVFVEALGHRAGAAGDWQRNMRAAAAELLNRCLQSVRRQEPIPAGPLLDWAEQIAGYVPDTPSLAIRADDLAYDQDALIARSLNVSILSTAIAAELGYRGAELRDVIVGSLLHDIGLAVPLEDKLALHHPAIGYDLLRKIPGFPAGSLQIVLQHHERIDGRGFPQGAAGHEIREASQICAFACDIDDFLNQSLTERLPHEGIEFAMSKIDTTCEYGVVRAFLNVFEPYPVGAAVTLTGRLEGTVVRVHAANPSRPVVRLRATGDLFDLMAHPAFRIECVHAARNSVHTGGSACPSLHRS